MELATTAQHNPSAFFSLKDRSHLDSQEPLPNTTHEYLEANGIRIHAVSLGRQPHKPLMLFVHGFPEFWYSWRHQLQHYSRDYDAVAIDMRGYGLSDKPPGVDSYRLDVLAADVAAVIEALGHERCVLVADDWGAAVSWVVAGMFPHRVHRLVTLSGLHTGLAVVNASPEQREKSWYIALFQVPHVAELFCTHSDMQFIADMFTPGTAWGPVSRTAFTETDREWYKWAFSQPGTVNAGLNYYRAYTKHMTNEPIPEVWHALKRRLHMPVLVIMGANDAAFTVQSIKNLDQVAPLSEVHVLEGCSHWVACEQPLKVLELMDKFMDKYPAQTPQGMEGRDAQQNLSKL